MTYVISTGGDYDVLPPSKSTWKKISKLKGDSADASYPNEVIFAVIETCTKPSPCFDPRQSQADKLYPAEMNWRDIAFLAQRCIEVHSEVWAAGPWDACISDIYDRFVKHCECEDRRNGIRIITKEEVIEALNRPPTTPPGVDLGTIVNGRSLYPGHVEERALVRRPFKSMHEVLAWVRKEHDSFLRSGPALKLLLSNTEESDNRRLERIKAVLRDAYRWRDFFAGSHAKRPAIPKSIEEAEDAIVAFMYLVSPRPSKPRSPSEWCKLLSDDRNIPISLDTFSRLRNNGDVTELPGSTTRKVILDLNSTAKYGFEED